jgi:hypothetical protein
MNKRLHIIYGVLKHQKPFDPEYLKNRQKPLDFITESGPIDAQGSMKPELFTDGTHLTTAGYAVMAEALDHVRKSRMLHNCPFAAAAAPFIARAPSLRFAEKRSRAAVKASFTNALLPITAPAVK